MQLSVCRVLFVMKMTSKNWVKNSSNSMLQLGWTNSQMENRTILNILGLISNLIILCEHSDKSWRGALWILMKIESRNILMSACGVLMLIVGIYTNRKNHRQKQCICEICITFVWLPPRTPLQVEKSMYFMCACFQIFRLLIWDICPRVGHMWKNYFYIILL